MAKNQKIAKKLAAAPKTFGVYLMKDRTGRIIYVGKSKNLKSRLGHYFNSPPDLYRTRTLVEYVDDFDVIMVSSEAEALLLERNLIKQYEPEFNIVYRDDKEYPYLRIDRQEDWPRLRIVRRRKKDGADYFGPYGQTHQMKDLLRLLYQVFPLVRCSPHQFANVPRPCTYYQLKKCLAPCHMPIRREDYLAVISQAKAFLRGERAAVRRELKERMLQAATNEDYDLAATYRDQLEALATIQDRTVAQSCNIDEADVIACCGDSSKVVFEVLTIREHTILYSENFRAKLGAKDLQEEFELFLLGYYERRDLPKQIIVNQEVADVTRLTEALAKKKRRTQIIVPKRGEKHDVLDMVIKNAKYRLRHNVVENKQPLIAKLEALQNLFELEKRPHRIECFDISNFQETATVAACVVFVDGKPAKHMYRYFKVRSNPDKPDDFGAMYEVLTRRLARKDWPKADLIVIDGGKGQLGAAQKALTESGELDIEMISLAKAKRRDGTALPERVFLPGADVAIPLEPGSSAYNLLVQIRDEAHRFAITFHRKKRSEEFFRS